MADPVPQKGFRTPPEVLSFFDDKQLRPAFSWQDVWGEEHAYAFTVAKAVELELLTLFKTSISTALANGQGFETWRKALMPQLATLGWAAPRTVEDSTGGDDPAEVDFSSPRRLRTIFWSNMNAARSAGQWDRAQRTKAGLPYILYVRTTAADPRPEHLGWVGTILPVDDPWWRTHWPPNGWGCKCSVSQTTARERDSLLATPPKPGGITYSATPPEDGPPRTFTNRRTGEITTVPAGIDPGWGGNPGLNRAQTLLTRVTEQLQVAGEDDARAAIAAIGASPLPRIITGLPEEIMMPTAITPPAVTKALGGGPAKVIQASNRDLGPQGTFYPQIQAALDGGHLVPNEAVGRRSLIARVVDGVRQVVLQVAGRGRVLLKAFKPV